jgi:hypothetical protein
LDDATTPTLLYSANNATGLQAILDNQKHEVYSRHYSIKTIQISEAAQYSFEALPLLLCHTHV